MCTCIISSRDRFLNRKLAYFYTVFWPSTYIEFSKYWQERMLLHTLDLILEEWETCLCSLLCSLSEFGASGFCKQSPFIGMWTAISLEKSSIIRMSPKHNELFESLKQQNLSTCEDWEQVPGRIIFFCRCIWTWTATVFVFEYEFYIRLYVNLYLKTWDGLSPRCKGTYDTEWWWIFCKTPASATILYFSRDLLICITYAFRCILL